MSTIDISRPYRDTRQRVTEPEPIEPHADADGPEDEVFDPYQFIPPPPSVWPRVFPGL